MEERHVAGYGIGFLLIGSDILEREDISPLEKLVLAYDSINETPCTSDKSCAESLGVPTEQVTAARDRLLKMGETVETHRSADLSEEEYYV